MLEHSLVVVRDAEFELETAAAVFDILLDRLEQLDVEIGGLMEDLKDV